MTLKRAGRGRGRATASMRGGIERSTSLSAEAVSACATFRSVSDFTDATRPEQLVGLGFRGWISGYQSGDVGCWEKVWRLYSGEFGARRAEAAVAGLSNFARSVNACSRRRVEVGPFGSTCFCRDESLAISMVAAFQHNTCPAMRACAFALVESSMLDEVLHHAGSFALTMRTLDAVIPPAWIVNANAFVGTPAASPN
ncbi:MAG: hypothetical protein JNM89_13040 [Hyphomicrobiaceae bacterium]|nr:hypothetical protein [Hyphomicrobiaceae bacterium]